MREFIDLSLQPGIVFLAAPDGRFEGGDAETMDLNAKREGFELLDRSQIRDFWRSRSVTRERLIAEGEQKALDERRFIAEQLASEMSARGASDREIELQLRLHGLK